MKQQSEANNILCKNCTEFIGGCLLITNFFQQVAGYVASVWPMLYKNSIITNQLSNWQDNVEALEKLTFWFPFFYRTFSIETIEQISIAFLYFSNLPIVSLNQFLYGRAWCEFRRAGKIFIWDLDSKQSRLTSSCENCLKERLIELGLQVHLNPYIVSEISN